MSRTKNSIKNMYVALIGQFFAILVTFFSRFIFIKIFSSEYLGLNSLFSNILTFLSVAELGFGSAITYSLYKPIAEKDEVQIKILMKLFKRIYLIVGVVILILGSCLTPFLNFFIKEIPNIENIAIIYVLFVLNTALSYFFSYKRTLIIAEQKKYISETYKYGSYIVMNFVQMIYLLLSKNYIVYLIIQVFFTLLENILISNKVEKMHPYLKDKNVDKIDFETKQEIIKNTKSMLMHKIGTILVNATDNIILSKYIGLIVTGIYSNYLLIIQGLEAVTGQIYTSLLASIGNLCVNENKEKQYDVFKNLNFITFWIFTFSSICSMCLFNPFIGIFFGEQYVFESIITLAIVVVYYIKGMRRPVIIFREAKGIFYQDRYRPIIESLVNLIFSIILVQKMGVLGIFIGTIISSIFTCIWLEALVLFKYGFEMKVLHYFKDYLKYVCFTILVGSFTYYICSTIIVHNLLLTLIIKFIICLIIPNLIIILIFYKTEEFKYLYNLIKEIFVKILKKESVI